MKIFDVILRTVFVVIAMDFISFAREIDFGNWKNRVWRIAQSFTVVRCNGRNRSTAHIAIVSALETCSSVHLLGASFFRVPSGTKRIHTNPNSKKSRFLLARFITWTRNGRVSIQSER